MCGHAVKKRRLKINTNKQRTCVYVRSDRCTTIKNAGGLKTHGKSLLSPSRSAKLSNVSFPIVGFWLYWCVKRGTGDNINNQGWGEEESQKQGRRT